MAVNESQFKAEIRYAAKVQRIFVVSNSPEFNIGIPDLMFKDPHLQPIFIELKWLKQRPVRAVPGLTPTQASWQRRYRAVGGDCTTLIGYPMPGRRWEAALDYQTGPVFNPITTDRNTFQRSAGEEWPILEILIAISQRNF